MKEDGPVRVQMMGEYGPLCAAVNEPTGFVENAPYNRRTGDYFAGLQRARRVVPTAAGLDVEQPEVLQSRFPLSTASSVVASIVVKGCSSAASLASRCLSEAHKRAGEVISSTANAVGYFRLLSYDSPADALRARLSTSSIVTVLGQQYNLDNPEEKQPFVSDFQSRILFTYRRGFKPIDVAPFSPPLRELTALPFPPSPAITGTPDTDSTSVAAISGIAEFQAPTLRHSGRQRRRRTHTKSPPSCKVLHTAVSACGGKGSDQLPGGRAPRINHGSEAARISTARGEALPRKKLSLVVADSAEAFSSEEATSLNKEQEQEGAGRERLFTKSLQRLSHNSRPRLQNYAPVPSKQAAPSSLVPRQRSPIILGSVSCISPSSCLSDGGSEDGDHVALESPSHKPSTLFGEDLTSYWCPDSADDGSPLPSRWHGNAATLSGTGAYVSGEQVPISLRTPVAAVCSPRSLSSPALKALSSLSAHRTSTHTRSCSDSNRSSEGLLTSTHSPKVSQNHKQQNGKVSQIAAPPLLNVSSPADIPHQQALEHYKSPQRGTSCCPQQEAKEQALSCRPAKRSGGQRHRLQNSELTFPLCSPPPAPPPAAPASAPPTPSIRVRNTGCFSGLQRGLPYVQHVVANRIFPGRLVSDAGWGCAVRATQMAVCQSLVCLRLGRRWRRASSAVRGSVGPVTLPARRPGLPSSMSAGAGLFQKGEKDPACDSELWPPSIDDSLRSPFHVEPEEKAWRGVEGSMRPQIQSLSSTEGRMYTRRDMSRHEATRMEAHKLGLAATCSNAPLGIAEKERASIANLDGDSGMSKSREGGGSGVEKGQSAEDLRDYSQYCWTEACPNGLHKSSPVIVGDDGYVGVEPLTWSSCSESGTAVLEGSGTTAGIDQSRNMGPLSCKFSERCGVASGKRGGNKKGSKGLRSAGISGGSWPKISTRQSPSRGLNARLPASNSSFFAKKWHLYDETDASLQCSSHQSTLTSPECTGVTTECVGDCEAIEACIDLFADTVEAPLSIHNIARCGAAVMGIGTGQWFGPTSCAQTVAHLINEDQCGSFPDLSCVVFPDGSLIQSEVEPLLILDEDDSISSDFSLGGSTIPDSEGEPSLPSSADRGSNGSPDDGSGRCSVLDSCSSIRKGICIEAVQQKRELSVSHGIVLGVESTAGPDMEHLALQNEVDKTELGSERSGGRVSTFTEEGTGSEMLGCPLDSSKVQHQGEVLQTDVEETIAALEGGLGISSPYFNAGGVPIEMRPRLQLKSHKAGPLLLQGGEALTPSSLNQQLLELLPHQAEGNMASCSTGVESLVSVSATSKVDVNLALGSPRAEHSLRLPVSSAKRVSQSPSEHYMTKHNALSERQQQYRNSTAPAMTASRVHTTCTTNEASLCVFSGKRPVVGEDDNFAGVLKPVENLKAWRDDGHGEKGNREAVQDVIRLQTTLPGVRSERSGVGKVEKFAAEKVEESRRIRQRGAVLIVLCMKLGANEFNCERYQRGLHRCFGLEQFQGLAGGGSWTSAHYFYGATSDGLLFLDPHSSIKAAHTSSRQSWRRNTGRRAGSMPPPEFREVSANLDENGLATLPDSNPLNLEAKNGMSQMRENGLRVEGSYYNAEGKPCSGRMHTKLNTGGSVHSVNESAAAFLPKAGVIHASSKLKNGKVSSLNTTTHPSNLDDFFPKAYEAPQLLPWKSLNPSMALFFLCKSRWDYYSLVRELKNISSATPDLFEILAVAPDYARAAESSWTSKQIITAEGDFCIFEGSGETLL